MKPSEVFKKAANILEENIKTTCCDAIGAAQDCHWSAQTKSKTLFEEFFKPDGVDPSDCWMGELCCPDAKEHRIWAMLFMAEITKRMK